MKLPVQITLKDVPPSEWLKIEIENRAEKLDHLFDRITACRVVVDGQKGKRYNVRIDLTVPGKELVVNKDRGSNLDATIHHAFDVAERQLGDFVRRRRR
jgi:ribosome-associated translation inhibitor RaiA